MAEVYKGKELKAGKRAWAERLPGTLGDQPRNPDGSLGVYHAYFESCRMNKHEPRCATYLLHMQRCFREHQ